MSAGRSAALVVLAVVALLAGCTQSPTGPAANATTSTTPAATAPPPAATARSDAIVALDTSSGTIWLDVYLDKTPITGSNFLNLTKSGFYDGTRFHRVIGPAKSPPNGFMIQGGDPNSRSSNTTLWGYGGSGHTIPDEYPRAANGSLLLDFNQSGVLAMANSGPNTGSSQFFITLAPQAFLDGRYPVFGRVIAGFDVAQSIGNVPTDSADRPVADVFLERATAIDAGLWR
jgi:peptidyl-prolyl cis-trans isomerase A (cyclophilin A)